MFFRLKRSFVLILFCPAVPMNKPPLILVPLRDAYRSNQFILFFFFSMVHHHFSQHFHPPNCYITSSIYKTGPGPDHLEWRGVKKKELLLVWRKQTSMALPSHPASRLRSYDSHLKDETEIPRSTIRQKISLVDPLKHCIWYVLQLLFHSFYSVNWLVSLSQMNMRSTRESKKVPTSAGVYQISFQCPSLEISNTSSNSHSFLPAGSPVHRWKHESTLSG